MLQGEAIGIAFGLFNLGMQAVAEAQKRGMLGGSVNWGVAVDDYLALRGNLDAFIDVWKEGGAQYDAINDLPPEEKYAEMKRIMYPTKLKDLVREVGGEIGPEPA